jgi:hypothetical protein
MMKSAFFGLLLGAAGACSATAHEPASATSIVAPVSCDVRAVRTANGVRIDASARAPASVAGEYELVITKIGPAGDSDIVQGGPFEIHGAQTLRLSGAELSLEPRGRYRARLTLQDSIGEICRDEVRS